MMIVMMTIVMMTMVMTGNRATQRPALISTGENFLTAVKPVLVASFEAMTTSSMTKTSCSSSMRSWLKSRR